MLLESLIKAMVELQGFRVVTVTGDKPTGVGGAKLVSRHPWGTAVSPPAAVGDRGGAPLCAPSRDVSSLRGRAPMYGLVIKLSDRSAATVL
jgi:hypothetical protein